MIEVKDLSRSYGKLLAVDHVSFEVARGETFGLLGPNGAGKSTTIHCLVGLLRPDAGVIKLDGESDPGRAPVRSRLGIAPQSLALYEDLSGEENLRLFGRLYGLHGDRLKRQVAWALEFAGLQDRRKDAVSKYSGGMKRRLNLACGLVHEPQVVFLDEPTVGVDPQARNHLFDSIEHLKKSGRTILYTTHYMEEAERLCDRVAIMDQGKVLALDTVDALIDKYGGPSCVEAELEQIPPEPGRLPGRLEGKHLRVESLKPMEELARIAAAQVGIRTLRVDRPDLEAVFLNLTGRRLRDA